MKHAQSLKTEDSLICERLPPIPITASQSVPDKVVDFAVAEPPNPDQFFELIELEAKLFVLQGCVVSHRYESIREAVEHWMGEEAAKTVASF